MTGAAKDDAASGPAVHYVRFLPHAPQRVWEALTNPQDMQEWMSATTVVLEGRVGGRFQMDGLLKGEGRVLDWQPLRRFEHDFRLRTASGFKDGGIVTYDLRPEGTGTWLTMTFRGASPALVSLFQRGQAATFDRLEAVLDGRPMPAAWGARDAA